MTQQSPYIRFDDGKSQEAMRFYQECLGGSLSLTEVKETPVAGQMPAELQDRIMHATLKSGNLVLLGSDMSCEEGFIKGNTFVLSLECSCEDEIHGHIPNLQVVEIPRIRSIHHVGAASMGSSLTSLE